MQSSQWHLAQINVGTTKYPLDDSRLDGFMSQLDAVNALADNSPGFIWRLQSDSGNATDVDVGGEPLFIINMSVWQSVESLFDYVYKSAHRDVMANRRDWFEKPRDAYQALWWVEVGHTPSPQEGLDRLALLNAHGPGERAFSFKKQFSSSGARLSSERIKP